MIFGNHETFAIEAEVKEPYGKWIYGNLRMWIGGVVIGNYDDASDLASSARWARVFLNHSKGRNWRGIDALTPSEVFADLYGKYLLRTPEGKGFQVPPENWDRFALTLDGVGDSSTEGLHGVLVVRIENETDLIISKDLQTSQILHTKLSEGLLDKIISAYLNWIIEQYPSVLENMQFE